MQPQEPTTGTAPRPSTRLGNALSREKGAIFLPPLRSTFAVQPQFILVITGMENVAVPTEPSPREPSRQFDLGFAAGAILLLPVVHLADC